ncbi:MAG: tetratricopeptide repeat protein [Bacteroidales bacterium]|nr:tetratricopeptide repeat protein [Bacteroidales bacterium]MDD3910746.1 tetratricopeptide repeat protein [Bacteroidales bacterium]MDD4421352.1 tetratricopeptide repeat protein [Bacteroidales bacterium]
MKTRFMITVCLTVVCAVSTNVSAQIKTEKTGTTNNLKWTIRYPGFCNLASSNEKIAEEIKDLLKKRQKQYYATALYKNIDDVFVTDSSVYVTTETVVSRNDTTVNLVRADKEINLYTKKWDDDNTLYIYLADAPLIYMSWNEEGKVLCNMLYTLQYRMNQKYFDRELRRLKDLKEREAGKTQTVEENQRRYIVQASAATNQQLYSKAIDYFSRAVSINPLSYPVAYYNMALLNSQIELFGTAIMNMKKYLLLAPDAPDARVAQDKIYEWEANFQQ